MPNGMSWQTNGRQKVPCASRSNIAIFDIPGSTGIKKTKGIFYISRGLSVKASDVINTASTPPKGNLL
jgi:hypothetical protein